VTASLPSSHAAFAAALLDPSAPVPAGWVAWNGSDPVKRFAVYRNNVMHSLVAVLGDTFPVVRELVGTDFFGAMAQRYIACHPPSSPLMHRYGETFPAWLEGFEPAAALAYLPGVARLELARLRAFHAADACAVDGQRLAQLLHEPERLLATAVKLAPSLTTLSFPHAVISLWSAHQLDAADRDAKLASIDLGRHESALVFRSGDDAIVLAVDPDDVCLAAALAEGTALGSALAAHPSVDLGRLLGLLLRHGLVVDLIEPPAAPST